MAETDTEDTPILRVIAETERPVEVGDLVMDPQGLLQHRSDANPVTLTFSYHGYSFVANVPAEPETPLVLRATLGAIPYSAESVYCRRLARTVLAQARLNRGRMVRDNHSQVHLEMWMEPPRPRTPANVVSTIVALLLDARPYLDLLGPTLQRSSAPLT
ncbi:hypothetical protein [Limimonas halophila]|uniref:hypothetical protein n=1 Tax=Limimonas halophila TaxID=1082479 RepID=UPI00115FC772|nr:hypothetical protein [Limimonas halophila]